MIGGSTAHKVTRTQIRDRRRALELLADCAYGCTEAVMLAHGLKHAVLVCLVRDGLATAEPERMCTSGQAIEVIRVKITMAGRRVLAGKL
jgi:hypothetical protein